MTQRPLRNVFGLMAAVTATASLFETSPIQAAIGHDAKVLKPEPEGKGIAVPKQRHAGGCNSAGCRTLDRCLCSCKRCKAQCNGQ